MIHVTTSFDASTCSAVKLKALSYPRLASALLYTCSNTCHCGRNGAPLLAVLDSSLLLLMLEGRAWYSFVPWTGSSLVGDLRIHKTCIGHSPTCCPSRPLADSADYRSWGRSEWMPTQWGQYWVWLEIPW